MHALIARKIERDQALLAIAHRNVERWRTRWKEEAPAWLTEWEELLKQPWQQIAALNTGLSENAARLRQSSPFAGVLTNEERWRIHEAFRVEHLSRAARSIADDREIVIIGSQSILGQFPNAPASLLVSAEAHVFPLNHPELSGVDEGTATLPRGWRDVR